MPLTGHDTVDLIRRKEKGIRFNSFMTADSCVIPSLSHLGVRDKPTTYD